MTAPRLSVVIPTRDRLGALRQTLDAIEAQARDGVEVVVVDNGSSDGTAEAIRARPAALPLTVVEERKPGPAAARNRGIEAARAPVVLLLGDDMRPADGVLAGHAALHDADPRPEYAVLGRVEWRADRPVNDFMRWLESGGPQFAFGALARGRVSTAEHLYTSQVSLKRELLLVHRFDERFEFAAIEDIELGLRLARAGVELDYHPELLVEHDHPQQPRAFARRQARVGESAWLLTEIHGDTGLMPLPRPTWPLLRALRPALAVVSGLPLPRRPRERVWDALTMAAYAAGWRAAARQLVGCSGTEPET